MEDLGRSQSDVAFKQTQMREGAVLAMSRRKIFQAERSKSKTL